MAATARIRSAGATVITPNRAELQQVVGSWADEADLHHKAEALRTRLGLKALLLTRSEEGMSLFEEGKVSHVQAQAREVADVTGAGDSLASGFLSALLSGLDLTQALRHGVAAAAITVRSPLAVAEEMSQAALQAALSLVPEAEGMA